MDSLISLGLHGLICALDLFGFPDPSGISTIWVIYHLPEAYEDLLTSATSVIIMLCEVDLCFLCSVRMLICHVPAMDPFILSYSLRWTRMMSIYSKEGIFVYYVP